jgi:hypothetical protein
MGEKAQPKPCKAMMNVVEEGNETIEEGQEKEPLAADLALITGAQKVEHYRHERPESASPDPTTPRPSSVLPHSFSKRKRRDPGSGCGPCAA